MISFISSADPLLLYCIIATFLYNVLKIVLKINKNVLKVVLKKMFLNLLLHQKSCYCSDGAVGIICIMRLINIYSKKDNGIKFGMSPDNSRWSVLPRLCGCLTNCITFNCLNTRICWRESFLQGTCHCFHPNQCSPAIDPQYIFAAEALTSSTMFKKPDVITSSGWQICCIQKPIYSCIIRSFDSVLSHRFSKG